MKPWYTIQARAAAKSADVFIYGDIGQSWYEESVTAAQFVADIKDLDVNTLNVRVNSIGGSVPDGLAIFNALRRHKANVTTCNDGQALSVASLILMAGDTIDMADNAMLMIHAPWCGIAGNAQELRDRANLLDKWAAAMSTAYVRPGGISQDEALAILTSREDHWYTAAEAKDAGFIDNIVAGLPIAATYTQNRFVPPARRVNPPAAAAAQPSVKEIAMQNRTTPPAAAPNAATPNQTTPAPVAPNAAGSDVFDASLAIDVDDVRAQALQQEASRRNQIKAIAKPFMARADIAAVTNNALDNPATSVESYRAQLLQQIGRNAEPLGGGLVMTIEDEHDKFRAAAISGIMIRSGLLANDPSNEFRGYSLMEFARATLHRKNISTKGMDKMAVVAAAFTHSTSDFDNLLADVANKSMLKGYDEAEETFQQWTSIGNLPDFKAAKRVDLNTFPALLEVAPGAEYKYATIGDRGEQIQLATYGRMFSINRQAIINDDLDAFTRVPNKMGRAAIRTVGNLVYAVLTSNPAMADTVALFHATHNNLLTAAAISTTSVDAADAAMAKQVDASNNTLNLGMAYLIVPRSLKGLALQVANSEYEIGSSTRNNTTPNWMRGVFEVIADARLDTVSSTTWYGSANPTMHDTIEVAYLDGNSAPTLEQQGGWTVDGVEFKVRIDAGVKALDFRGLVKNPN
jgi:ATP-dependent protease ClpP protease subunit